MSKLHGTARTARPVRRPLFSSRMRTLVVIFAVCSLVLGIRLFDLQFLRSEQLSAAADAFRTRTYTLHAQRGDIRDSSGAVLATSVERYNIGVNQKLIGDYVHYATDAEGNLQRDATGAPVVAGTGAAEAAKVLAPILKTDRAELGGKMIGGEKKSTFVYIAKDISPETWREIASLGIPGIEPEQYMKRDYPNGPVAGNILGYVGETAEQPESVGQAGIERTQEDILAGKDGEYTVQVAGGGAVVPNGTATRVEPENGRSVTLTIDRDLQNSLMAALDKSVDANQAQWGSAVVIEIGTGRTLALADSHSPDPSNLAGTSPENWGSRAVQAPVEPGSTGKIPTFAAAIDQGSVTPLSTFGVPDKITMPNGETISDNDEHPNRQMTVAGIMALSYNTGLVQVGDTVPDETRFEYMKSFGIGTPTGIELPVESAGILRDPSTWDNRTRYTTMFGQGWAATTVQLGQIAATIGNHGVYVPLRIIDAVSDPDGAQIPTGPGESHRVISEESAATMLNMMQGVTQPGATGWAARVDGYNVAGKTGTAQVPDAAGNLTERVGTFIGVVPAENPQIAIAVTVYGGAGAGYGGETGAPVFKEVAQFATRQLGIPPSEVPLYKYPWYASDIG
ncbi:peptidoglycan D,D-transpeptidase FtsI family protein [Actinobaculum suis]|uniref:peptidoglycan D,D-transpeptidase FtsI family protein n=1 Tax=Actinobaculum suis TaxID=1657 RepID=UPI0008087474|nr:penicillin-binding protein 2 [Actinobaculum suis]OCA93313.1 penicillin-binding protein [Actinobaculum suis]OCA94466.1 penicillin-binding protein [Actinobaculum suis]